MSYTLLPLLPQELMWEGFSSSYCNGPYARPYPEPPAEKLLLSISHQISCTLEV